MKIIYIPSFHTDEEELIYDADENYIILKKDNWNDFGYYTFFHFSIRFENKIYQLGGVRILFEDETNSHLEFSNLNYEERTNYRILESISSNKKFISLLSSNKSYKLLKEIFTIPETLYDVLNSLHELSYLEKYNPTSPDINLKESEGFNDSLTRDSDSQKSIQEASHILFGDELDPDRFNFRFNFKLDNFDDVHSIHFNFYDEFFPSNIITLIGKNGTGKTQTLKHLSECLQSVGLASKENREKEAYNTKEAFSKDYPYDRNQVDDSFFTKPPFSKVVLISYSPFENFYNGGKAKSFSYSGLREKNSTNISKDVVFNDMKSSLNQMIKDDLDSSDYESTILKVNKLYEVLKIAIPEFENIGLTLEQEIFEKQKVYALESQNSMQVHDNFLLIKNYSKEELREYTYKDSVHLKISPKVIQEICFLDENNKKLELSSGQEIFTYMIFAILGKIEEESLLIFDEPESYLHPNLEITFMRLLKEILKMFKSYCIMATHSLIMTRETPSDFVRIFDVVEKKPIIIKPSGIETFGASLNSICNYTFENALEDKPFENWLKGHISSSNTIDEILVNYQDKLNPETLMFIRNEILDD